MPTCTIDRHTIELTNLDKVYFPKGAITKGDLVAYYHTAAPIILPHLKDRPLTMHRFPDGITKDGFYQKDIGEYFPSWVKRVTIPKQENDTNTYVICNNAATLLYVANQACITPHIWLSRQPKLDYPDKMIFDLDPGTNDFELVKQTALALREQLDAFGLVVYPMVTGSRGMHVIVPLKRRYSFDDVRTCARALANHLVTLDGGKHLTTEVRLEKRKKHLFIDVTRNAWAQTTVAPYAVRALPGAPIATPVTWDEVACKALTAQKFTIKNIEKRLDKIGDPLANYHQKPSSLSKVVKLII